MAKTLLQIVQAAFPEMGLNAPGYIVGNLDSSAVQALALLNREGLELADIPGAWPTLRGEQIITLVPGTEAYNFPADIAYYREGTEWDRSTHWRVLGPISDREWQRFRSSVSVTSPYLRYRIFGGQVHFDPVPSSADTIVFEYVSANWCAANDGTPKAAFTADTDVPLLPDDLFVLGLKWRWLAAKGMNYAEERAAYDAAVDRKQARSEVSPPLRINQRGPRFGALAAGIIPDGNFPGRS